MKKIFLLIAIALSVTVNAQVTQVSLQASGLTCSMCSNSINKALMTLDFDLIKKKVENAGFSVSGFVATIHFNNIPILNNQTATIEDKTFLFANTKNQSLNGFKKVKILDKGFITAREYKRNAFPEASLHTYHATL